MRVCVVGVLLLLVAACGSEAAPEEAPRKAKAIKTLYTPDLAIMVVPKEDVGGLPLGLRVTPDSGPKDNRSQAAASLDSTDSPSSLASVGRVDGYYLRYGDPTLAALRRGRGLLSFFTSVERFRSERAASTYLHARAAWFLDHTGETAQDGLHIRDASKFAAGGGDEAVGVRSHYVAGRDEAHTVHIILRRDRIVGSASFTYAHRPDNTMDAERLAGILDGRIKQELYGELHEKPVPLPHAPQEPKEAPLGAPDLAGVVTRPDEVPASLFVVADGVVATGPRLGYRRVYASGAACTDPPGLTQVRNEVNVYELDAAAVFAFNNHVWGLSGAQARKTFATNYAASSGMVATKVRVREVTKGDRMFALEATYEACGRKFKDLYLVARVERGIVSLEVTGVAGTLDYEGASQLLEPVQERLERLLTQAPAGSA